jgi:hypothetical protein
MCPGVRVPSNRVAVHFSNNKGGSVEYFTFVNKENGVLDSLFESPVDAEMSAAIARGVSVQLPAWALISFTTAFAAFRPSVRTPFLFFCAL